MDAIRTTRAERQRLKTENAKQPVRLARVPSAQWPRDASSPGAPTEVWRSRSLLVMVYEDRGFERLSVLKPQISGVRWQDGLSWDDLQRAKRETGRGSQWAVEVFPDDAHVINVANIRHLWLLPSAPEYGWRNERR